MLTVRDLTDVHRLQETTRENELSKMLQATLSHEVMTPLKCIMTFVASILKATDTATAHKYANLIQNTAKILRLQMHNMLDRSQFEVGGFKPNLERASIMNTVTEIVEILQS